MTITGIFKHNLNLPEIYLGYTKMESKESIFFLKVQTMIDVRQDFGKGMHGKLWHVVCDVCLRQV
jgi:hypothetical protein